MVTLVNLLYLVLHKIRCIVQCIPILTGNKIKANLDDNGQQHTTHGPEHKQEMRLSCNNK